MALPLFSPIATTWEPQFLFSFPTFERHSPLTSNRFRFVVRIWLLSHKRSQHSLSHFEPHCLGETISTTSIQQLTSAFTMPPKASHRRNARLSSREPEQAPLESPGQLARTHLPALHGTPSSRRQYSYGSALEPPPRPGAGLQKVDISNAVSEALTRRPEDLDDGAFVRPPRPQARTAAIEDEDEEDELARDSRAAKKTGAPARDESRRGKFILIAQSTGL